MVTSDPATGPGDATVPWAAEPLDARNTEFRKRVSSNSRPDARAVFVFSAPDACHRKGACISGSEQCGQPGHSESTCLQ